jgi:DNA-binding NtrC family response regulator
MRKQTVTDDTPTAFVNRPTGILGVLFVNSNGEDCVSLERIFKSDWTLIPSAAVASALFVLRQATFPIVLFDADITTGRWREMLDQISFLPDPPLFIVTSRLADDHLWAEALNLGAWDVLAKPFDTQEVIRIVSSAWQHWQDRHGIHSGRTAQRRAAAAA